MRQPTKELRVKKQSNSQSSKRYKKSKTHTNTQKSLPVVTIKIDSLLHDGRGVGIYTADNAEHPHDKHGKKVFVSQALPGEIVKIQITKVKKSFEEADCLEVLHQKNEERQNPICEHFSTCGGCSLQHWQPNAQIAFKEAVLKEHLKHQANTIPENWLKPITGQQIGYRTKARIGVRHLSTGTRPDTHGRTKRAPRTIVGFREKSSNRLIDIDHCPILHPYVNEHLQELKQLFHELDHAGSISHLEVAVGENIPELSESQMSVAIIIRHLKPFSHSDLTKLQTFFSKKNWQLYLQGQKKISSIVCMNKGNGSVTNRLYYKFSDFDLIYEFFPTDFTQVNMSVNEKMVKLACELLDLQIGERVLDLFSGLGNFSLAMATLVGGIKRDQGMVIGVEGSDRMTKRSKDNAKRNGLTNTQFFTHDLTKDPIEQDVMQKQPELQWANEIEFDALLIDPPRSGAWEVMQYLPKFNAKRIVYVSCDPATLARDSKMLIESGYRMTHAGVMDMFCHTSHVESIVRFEKIEV